MSRPVCGGCGDLVGDSGCGGGQCGPATAGSGCASSVPCAADDRCAACEINALRAESTSQRNRAEIAEHDLAESRRATEAAHTHRHELMVEVAALRAEVVRAEMAQQEQLLDALAERTAERDRYRRALEEIAQDCDCERRGCGEGAHWASCSTLCGSAPARARKALEVAP